MTAKNYKLIPIEQITDEARELAVLWVEGLSESGGFNIAEKHKLASDIMNYAEEYAEIRVKEATKNNIPKEYFKSNREEK